MQLASYTIEEMETAAGGPRHFLLTVNEKPYRVGELLCVILQHIAERRSSADIVPLLNGWAAGRHVFTAQEVDQIIEHKIRPLGVFNTSVSASPTLTDTHRLNGVRWRKTLLRYTQMRWALIGLQWLFTPAVFWPLLAVMVGANYYYMNSLIAAEKYVETYAAANKDCLKDISYFALFYPIILLTLLIHEVGHAAASYRFGVKPKDIGFGVYLVFPVLYADVTGIWRLNKHKRAIVNLAGIFMQLLINIGLIWYTYHADANIDVITTFRYLLHINVSIMLINSIPFLMFDGYWLYSDLFGLPNLQKQASAVFLKYTKKIIPQIPYSLPPQAEKMINFRNPLLLTYTAGRYLFLAYFIAYGFGIFAKTIANLPSVFYQIYIDFSVCSIEPFLQSSLTVGMFGYFFAQYSRTGRQVFRTIRKA
ncbi:M50 family metallopeptidase [Spirosoma validum]|uniref:M50 family metallopeptidase n=1 Tax=Spirosoma validum TaxID=2771355 RepID=A0A927B2D8_9BACT|nr:M50 family metallopeptidase [Spirosoma validum]MBD2754081.1 M50 family metallopeptidase [Spirosoma validum]